MCIKGENLLPLLAMRIRRQLFIPDIAGTDYRFNFMNFLSIFHDAGGPIEYAEASTMVNSTSNA
jgi:hypothetical protein